ncbi:MAG: ferredoxin [Kordiimonas sp.]|nr:ferredoxin [Kordiimonas sp.]
MTHVICQPCIGTKDSACAQVCPVNCIFEQPDQYVIDAKACVDCGACIAACPVSAIYPAHKVPEEWADFKLSA